MKTDNRYIIVIQVDNIRAREAYAKGLADFDIAMPVLMADAQAKDDENKAAVDEKLAAYASKRAAHVEAMAAYEASVAAKKAWDNSSMWHRDVMPHVLPRPERDYSVYEYAYLPRQLHFTETNVYRLNNMRTALVDKLNLATAAMAPFSMTEFDVQYMISWEDGSYVANLQKRLALR